MATTLDSVTVTGKSLQTSSFKISDFKTKLGNIVRPNLFDCILTGYSKVQGLTSGSLPDIDDTFPFRCERAELPGRTLATVDDMVGGGTAMKLPYDVVYTDIQISVICSADMKERAFFETWIDKIVGAPGRKGGLLAYYSDYAQGVQLIVSQLDEAGNPLLIYTLHDCFPIALTGMTATWEETNTYQRFGVTMAYRYHTYEI